MRGAVIACALFAGCGSDGISVEVRPPAGVAATEVELFLGLDACSIDGTRCDRIQPQDFDRPVAAAVYFRQPESLVAPVTDGAARFVFQAEDRTVPALIAVAFDGDAAVGVATIADFDLRKQPLHVIIDQSAAEVLTQQGGAGDRVAVWYRDRHARCVGATRSDGGLVFVVPESDPDCDAVATECDPLAYLVTRPGDQACIDTFPAASGRACMLGGVPCREDPMAPAPACVTAPEPSCVPGAACDCSVTDLPCLQAKLAGDTVARVACTLRGSPNPDNASELIPCTTGVGAEPPRLGLDPLAFTFKCPTSPKLGPATLPLALGDQLGLEGQTIKLTSFNPLPCGVGFEWVGTVTAATPARQDGVLSLEIEAGVPAKRRHLLLPIAVSFTENCATAGECKLVTGGETDSIWSCAH